MRQAVEIDPNFALGHAWLAGTWRDLTTFGYFSPISEGYKRARQAAEKAVNLDPSLAEAHAVLCLIKFEGWDLAGAEEEYLRAKGLPPGGLTHSLGIFLTLTGRSAEALALYERHNESNPLNPINEVWTLFYAGNYPAAIAAADMEIKIDPNAWFHRSIRSNCLALMNRCAEALSESDAILSDMPAVRSDASTLIQLGGNYALCGDRKKAREMLDALLKTDSSREDPSWLAWIYAPLGEKELALSALEKGYELHSNGMVYIKVDPFFDSLRDDPRFKALLKKVGFEK